MRIIKCVLKSVKMWVFQRVAEAEKRRNGVTENETGLCTVYSSGGCTFLRSDHMTGGILRGVGRKVGATIVGLNYLVGPTGGRESSRVKQHLCKISSVSETEIAAGDE